MVESALDRALKKHPEEELQEEEERARSKSVPRLGSERKSRARAREDATVRESERSP